jgi:tRNA wybutosine-synthesizing protein 4
LGDKLADNLSCYFEIDFDEVTTKKAMIIKRQAELSKHLLDIKIERGGMDLKSQDYCLLGGDLRHWPEVSNQLIRAGFDSK